MIRHFLFRVFGLILVTFALGACEEQVESPLRVGTNVWPGYEPAYLAQDLGYYTDKDIQLRQFQSATENIRAFRNGVIDVVALTLDEALLLLQDGFDIRIFLVADVSNGGDVIMARPEYPTMASLKGRMIGVENNALGAYVLARAMEIHGLSTGDVNIFPITVDQSGQVYDEMRVDAVVTFEPFRSHLLKKGAVEVFTSREMPNEIVDVLVTRADLLEQRRDQLKMLTEGWVKAVTFIKEQSENASELLGRRLELTPEDALSSFDGLVLPDRSLNGDLLSGEGPSSLASNVGRLTNIMLEKKLLLNGVASDHLFYDGFVSR